MSLENLAIFTGNANPELAKKVAQYIGRDLSRARVEQFSDGEIMVEINEHIRGRDIFIIQRVSTQLNISDYLTKIIGWFLYGRHCGDIMGYNEPKY